jgi:hypothetical protein
MILLALDEAPAEVRQHYAEKLIEKRLTEALQIAVSLDWTVGSGDEARNVRDMLDDLIQKYLPRLDDPPQYRKRALSAAIRRQVLERDAYRCQWPACGSWVDLTVDHIVPEVQGGTADLDNLQTLCRPHNSEKGVKVL